MKLSFLVTPPPPPCLLKPNLSSFYSSFYYKSLSLLLSPIALVFLLFCPLFFFFFFSKPLYTFKFSLRVLHLFFNQYTSNLLWDQWEHTLGAVMAFFFIRFTIFCTFQLLQNVQTSDLSTFRESPWGVVAILAI